MFDKKDLIILTSLRKKSFQSILRNDVREIDCFVASLLAMTKTGLKPCNQVWANTSQRQVQI